MKLKQILAIVLSLALVACISVAATVAYLTSVTETVTNTFTVGDIDITLDEQNVDKKPNSSPDRDTTNEYQLFPGSTYVKDPTVHVKAGSEASYIFVKVTDQIASLEVNDTTNPSVYQQILNKGWFFVEGSLSTSMTQDNWSAVFYKTVDKVDKDTDLVVFENFKIKADVTSDTLAKYQGKTVVINAYAIQQANLNVSQAWNAVKNLTPANDGNNDTTNPDPEEGGEDAGSN